MAEYEKKVREILKNNGCYFLRQGKGDHEIWHSPINNKNVTVDKVIKSRYTANAVLKQSGIEERFH